MKNAMRKPADNAGAQTADYTCHVDSPLGGITLAGDGEALTGLWFDGQKYFAETLRCRHEERMLPVFAETKRWLEIYFRGENPGFTPKLKMRTTSFRKDVWEILLEIPYGKTMTYGEIAERVAQKEHLPRMSAQAIGGAVAHNAISLIIPCHRVVGADGSLTGYAGGIRKKIILLETENADLRGFHIPERICSEECGKR